MSPTKPKELILDALAVSEDALTLTLLSKVLASAGVRVSGKKPTATLVRPWVDELAAADLVKPGSRIEPVHPAAEQRVRELMRSGRYEEMVGWVAAAEPLKPRSRWGYDDVRPGTIAREYRRAIHCGDVKTLTELKRRLKVTMWGWFCDSVDLDQLQALSSPMAAEVLAHLSRVAFQNAIPAPGLRELIYSRALQQPELLESAASEAILHGEQDRADAFLRQLDKDAAPHLRALRRLIEGDIEGSVKLYARGLTAERKQRGTTKVLPTETAALFLPLAYLLSKGKSRHSQARKLIEQADKEDFIVELLPWGGWAHLRFLNESGAEAELVCAHPIAVLLEGLCAWWRGEELDVARHQAAIAKAKACGWGWIADELVCAKEGEGLGLGSLRVVRADWEERLELLSELLNSKPARASSPSDRRLAWRLRTGEGWLDLEAREQLRRGAKWSVGRKVSAARLLSDLPSCATPTDRALVAALSSKSYRNYRGYPEVEFSWDPAKAWSALVDHLAVFDDKGSPLTIVGIKPRIAVKRSRGVSTVRIEPPVTDDRVKVTKVGNGYEVTIFTEEQLRIAEVIGAGMTVPAKGKETLSGVLTATDGIFASATTRTATKTKPGDPAVVVRLHPIGRGFDVELVVQPMGPEGNRFSPGVGSAIVLGRLDGEAMRFRRNLKTEAANMEAILGLPGLIEAEAVGERWRLAEAESCLVLLEALKEAGVDVFWPDKVGFVFRRTVQASDLDLSIREVKNWFQATGKLKVDDGLVLTLGELLAAVLSSEGRFVRLSDGSFIALQSSLQRDLEALARTAQKKKSALSVHPLASRALASLAASSDAAVDAGFTRHLEALAEIPESTPLPADLRTTLRAYQEDAFQWLARLSFSGVGALLADDMGLGKTVVTLALLLHRRPEGPALIIAPTSVAGNWAREMLRFAPTLTPRRLRDASDRAALVKAAGPGDAVICSYGLLVSEAELLQSRQWAAVIFDESQAVKNPSTQRHKTAAVLPAGMRVALTGTPIENHLGELHAQFAILNPGMLGSRTGFRSRFQRPIESGDATVRRHLKSLVSPYLLRRTKGQVLDELPSRTDINVPVELGAEEAALYEAQRLAALEAIESKEETDSAVAVLAQLTRLRLLACSPQLVVEDFAGRGAKLAAFAQIAANLQSGGHRALVFSQFVKHLALIRAWLDEQKITYQYLDGSTPARQRDLRVAAFQSGTDPFFLISTKAGGQGLNLTAADYVIHMDPWWNPAVEDQASDRAHRLGQRRPVTVYRLYAQGTVEEQILALHHTKRSLADGILEGADTATRLSAAQLLDLMRTGMGGE